MTLRARLALWFVPITLALVLVPWWVTRPSNSLNVSSLQPEVTGAVAPSSAPVTVPSSEQDRKGAPATPEAPAESKAATSSAQQKPTAPSAQDANTAAPARPVTPAPAARAEREPSGALADAIPASRDEATPLQQQLEQLRDRQGPVLLRYEQGKLEVLENPPTTPSSPPWIWGGVMLAGAWLVGAWGIRRSLAPLYHLAAEIARRGPTRLDALEPPPLPELRPAVAALNKLLEELRETLARLELQEQSAKRFAYNASHELRNPLTAARNYLEVLERHPGELEAGVKALEAVRRTEKVLSSLLTLARLEGRGRVRGERVDLRSFLEANFELPVEGEAIVWAERDLLELAVDNLVKNAEEHSTGAARAHLETVPSGVWVWLEDDGPGFPPDLLNRAFEPFVKGGSSTGLGLAIVEAVARAHGGEVRAENRSGGGARVGLRLPSGSHQV